MVRGYGRTTSFILLSFISFHFFHKNLCILFIHFILLQCFDNTQWLNFPKLCANILFENTHFLIKNSFFLKCLLSIRILNKIFDGTKNLPFESFSSNSKNSIQICSSISIFIKSVQNCYQIIECILNLSNSSLNTSRNIPYNSTQIN